MTQYNYPHTIDNGAGEQLTFIRLAIDENGEFLEVENLIQPNSGPPMHVHFKQAEGLTIIKGKMGAQILEGKEIFYVEGELVVFQPGEAHRFWNAGTEPLVCQGWIRPADNIEYFLTEIYKSTKANGGKQPDKFDAAYLLTKYASEFALMGIPRFVKKVIFPISIFFGKLAGKHKKFNDGPDPL